MIKGDCTDWQPVELRNESQQRSAKNCSSRPLEDRFLLLSQYYNVQLYNRNKHVYSLVQKIVNSVLRDNSTVL